MCTSSATGKLLLIDNQIDQTTSTIRIKAIFPNEDERLWPGQFVRARVLVETLKDAVTIPQAAVQRNSQGLLRLGDQCGQYRGEPADRGRPDRRRA